MGGRSVVTDSGDSSSEDGGDGYGSIGNESLNFGIEIDVGADGGVTLTCG